MADRLPLGEMMRQVEGVASSGLSRFSGNPAREGCNKGHRDFFKCHFLTPDRPLKYKAFSREKKHQIYFHAWCFNINIPLMGPRQKEERESLQLCREGNLDELSRVFTELLPALKSQLQTLGASQSEADSLAAEVLSDCLVGTLKRPPLIRQFQGRSSLATWMAAVARNRYYDFMRGQKMDRSIAAQLQDALEGNEQWVVNDIQEEHVFEALREALTKAFQALSAFDAVLLQLVHAHKVDQRVLARFLGWSDTKMSRHLSTLRTDVKFHVHSALRHIDNSQPPCWKDLMEICGRLVEPL